MNIKTFLIIAILINAVFASIGFEGTVQKPFNATGKWPLIGATFIVTPKKPPFYYSSGIFIRPGEKIGAETNLQYQSKVTKVHSLYGIYGGTNIALSPAFRPGLIAGIAFKKEEVLDSDTKKRISYTSYKVNPYIGFTIHSFILSFVVTNVSIGGGINLNFGNRY